MIVKRGAGEYSGGVGVKNGLVEAAEEGLRLALQTGLHEERVELHSRSRVDGMQNRMVRSFPCVVPWPGGCRHQGTRGHHPIKVLSSGIVQTT